MYTVPEKGGPRTLVKMKAGAKCLKDKYLSILEPHLEGDIRIILLDHPLEEDSGDDI